MNAFDVIVVGGGHAGTEAAAVAARCGARVALVTMNSAAIGAMSCNPAIGGVGKGHLVREVDAFDGVMGRAADAAAIHHRMLNRSKGLAVQGPRIQADRRRYAGAVQAMLARLPGLTIVEGEAAALALDRGTVVGLTLASGDRFTARSVVLATGTFLGGRIFRGEEREAGGRIGERPATVLARQLRDAALPMARLKTGTPPRLDGRTIDWAALTPQASDADPWTMSPLTRVRGLPQIACAITRTRDATHDIIRASLDRSPLFSGAIAAAGPRYCPSIEDKVHRFGDRDGHQIFLEPEGLDTPLVYPNGISTSLPIDAQAAMIASIPGLARAAIVTPGYAVEYDHLDPRALDRTLMVEAVPGLFAAGQINGTTGYEEAAGQGLIAGLNAAARALDRAPTIVERDQGYLGVMIDDLVLQGVTEPYRMLTARAEHRLHLRADNAETRLSGLAEAAGCLGDARRRHIESRMARRAAWIRRLGATLSPTDILQGGGRVAQDGVRRPIGEWLRFDGVSVQTLLPDADPDDPVVREVVEDARYAPYVERQRADAAAVASDAALSLPATMRYGDVPGLSHEMRERLTAARPTDLAAAARVRGVSPAALAAILLHVKRAA